ncbi:DUF2807 domain-containing protein [Photobacterium sp. WH24]|uniref:DUF2807 domain-containing protein n=1 Tax=Photobacterium arenosum TaxID=2774143 RepID=A0ABR9BG83_9GAMM|nr:MULTISPECIES: DUF2807 domain-containing protein [Photobacterium]MBD8511575.1 DUF2807 domain-containing protein [Photobacterium arenosum]MBV7264158.1 DUF2807 domain-containing protein [Photobacterium sp. WH24]
MKKVILPAALAGIALYTGIINFSFADEQTRTESVRAFNKLSVEKGLEVSVHCSDKNYLEATGKAAALEKLTVTEQQGTLQISNRSGDDWENIEPLTVHIYTSQPLQRLDARFGIDATVDGCAIASDSFAATGEMGSKLVLSGSTDTLTLALAMGATLDHAAQPLHVNQATVELGMGASASLCHAKSVSGRQSAGTRLSVSPDTQTKVNGSYGTSIVFDAC